VEEPEEELVQEVVARAGWQASVEVVREERERMVSVAIVPVESDLAVLAFRVVARGHKAKQSRARADDSFSTSPMSAHLWTLEPIRLQHFVNVEGPDAEHSPMVSAATRSPSGQLNSAYSF
jgi:hypothetical protein